MNGAGFKIFSTGFFEESEQVVGIENVMNFAVSYPKL